MACPDENQLALLADVAIAAGTRVELERHLDGCAACSELVTELARLEPPLRSVPDRYKIVRQLGAGAMGVVWEAEDTKLARKVALKWVAQDGASDLERRARLLREARALAQLRHPNVLAVYDVGELGDELYFAMELVVGTTARVWRNQRRTVGEVLAVWRQVGLGLAAVHRTGIVHRDIKPDNVLVADDHRVLVVDFGLATGDLGNTALSLTVSGQVLGTPLYMSPEQLVGEMATAASDQFALCVCLWEALVGTRPFTGDTIAALALAMTRPLEIPSVAGLERRVLEVLARGLARSPEKRWPNIEALLAALEARPKRRSVPIAIAMLALVAISGGIAVSQMRGEEPQRPPSRQPQPSPSPSPSPSSDLTAPPIRGIPIAPAPKATPAVISPWRQTLDRATDRLAAGDGPGCLALLDRIAPVTANAAEEAEGLAWRCTMVSGDCAKGRAMVEQFGRAQGLNTKKVAAEADQDDLVYCPIDAPPRAKWPERALMRLEYVDAVKRSCKPVLDQIEKLGLVMPDPRRFDSVRVSCAVRAGDCAEARAIWHHLMLAEVSVGDPARGALEHEADASFPRAYPACP